MSNFISALENSKVLLLDGGLATELERCVELHNTLWSAGCLITNPDAIQNVHEKYLGVYSWLVPPTWKEAGADIISTASYQASIDGFFAVGKTEKEAHNLVNLSCELAASAATNFVSSGGKKKIFIAASIGPYGAFLADGSEYTGSYAKNISVEKLELFHKKRLEIVSKNPAVDLILCETIPCIMEAEILANLAKHIAPDLPVFMSFSCKDSEYLNSGEPILQALKSCEKYSQIIGIGVNCLKPHFVLPIIQLMKMHTKKYIIVYPNSGEWDTSEKVWNPNLGKNDELPKLAVEWCKTGAKVVGGCCRTSPSEIAAIRKALDEYTRE